MNKPVRDRGAALITVLTMVSIMSALAIVAVDAADMSTRRTINQTRMDQTRWYLIGAEAFAASRLADVQRRDNARPIDQSDWQARAFTFPLDDGTMRITLYDGNNCFNLNSVVQQSDGAGSAPSAAGIMQFARLLDLLGVRSDRAGLGATLADWIDADSAPSPGGLEQGSYANGAQYQPANTLMADVSELRRVQGFNEEIMARIANVVCVRPAAAANLLNPNTLRVEQAPLLATVLPDLTVEKAEQIIRDRPRGGWPDLDAFFSHSFLASLEMNDVRRASFTMESAYFVMTAEIFRDEGRESEAALISMQSGGAGVVVRRIFGAGAAETLL